MLAVHVRERRPERDTQETDASEDGAERQPGQQFPSHDLPPVAQGDLPERQRTDDERRCLRTGVAAARDDERDEECQDDGLGDLRFEGAHGRGRQHFAEEQRREPPRALLDHPREGDVHVRLVEGLRTADPLDFTRGPCLGDVQHVVDRDDADEHAGRVGDRQRAPVVLPEDGDRRVLVVGRLQRDEPPVHHVGDTAFGRGQQELADPDVVDEQVVLVHDVDDIEGFAVLAVRAHVVEHFADGPLLPYGHVVRCHQPADRLLRDSRAALPRHRARRASADRAAGAWPRRAAPRGTSCARRAPCCSAVPRRLPGPSPSGGLLGLL